MGEIDPVGGSVKKSDRLLHEAGFADPAIAGDECVAVLEKVGDNLFELCRTANEERVLSEIGKGRLGDGEIGGLGDHSFPCICGFAGCPEYDGA